MNLLHRSISSSAATAVTSPAPRSHHVTKPQSAHTHTHLLFHLPDGAQNEGEGGGNNFNLLNRKASKKGKSGGFGDATHEATSNFDYYEYFSNYGRLFASTTPPESPTNREETIEVRGPRSGGPTLRVHHADENGSKKLWRRSGPPKYELVKAAESPTPERRPRHPLEVRQQSPSPSIQRKESHGKGLKRVPSSPITLPELLISQSPPLLSPPAEAMGGGAARSSVPFRISLIETNVYLPIDIQTSPEHLPHHRFRKHCHRRWVSETVQQLKEHFKLPSTQLLVNAEKLCKYPFLVFGSLGLGFDSGPILPTAEFNTLSPELRISDGVYDIRGSYTCPRYREPLQPTLPPGYIVSIFQTFPGEDSDRLESHWFKWTGASSLYSSLSEEVGLRRLIFYKRHDLHLLKTKQENNTPLFAYILFCECFDLKESLLSYTCSVIDRIRARCCGYSALYINQI